MSEPTSTDNLVRLRLLLPHWIEHNEEHAGEFRKWAERARDAGEVHVADHLLTAAQKLVQATEALQGALDHLGGVPSSPDHEHPHSHAHG